MSEPSRLRDGSGAAGRLLRSAERDFPSERARRRALAFAGAATTLATAGTSAAAAGGVLLKAVALWFCVGAAGGVVAGYAGTELSKPAPRSLPAPSARAVVLTSVAPAPPALVARAADEPLVVAPPAPPLAASPERRPAPAAVAEPEPASEPVRVAAGSSVAAFAGDEPKPALFEELKQIEAARAAVGRGDSSAALATLARYERAYPAGNFRPEALALRIQALAKSGDRQQAQLLAAEFKRRYPQHPLLPHVRAAVGE